MAIHGSLVHGQAQTISLPRNETITVGESWERVKGAIPLTDLTIHDATAEGASKVELRADLGHGIVDVEIEVEGPDSGLEI